MNAKNLVGLALLGVGGYYLAKYLGINLPSFGTQQPATTTPSNSNPVYTADVGDRVLAEAVKHGVPADSLQSVHDWNWYYLQVRGVPGPNPDLIFPGGGDLKYTFAEYWSAMKNKGFNGLGGFGLIAQYNPYQNPYTPRRGNALNATGMEKAKIYIQ